MSSVNIANTSSIN